MQTPVRATDEERKAVLTIKPESLTVAKLRSLLGKHGKLQDMQHFNKPELLDMMKELQQVHF